MTRFSASDLRVLKKMVSDNRSLTYGDPINQKQYQRNIYRHVGKVKTDETWNPTNFETDPYLLSFYELPIWKFDDSDELEDEMQPVKFADDSDYKIKAYNPTGQEITEGTGFVFISRDRYGTWFLDISPSACLGRNEIWQLRLAGPPDGGTCTFTFTVNEVEHTVNDIPFDITAAELQTLLEAHPEITAGDIGCGAGPFPVAPISVEFKQDYASVDMVGEFTGTPYFNIGALTSGSGVGIAGDVFRLQPGSA